MGNSGSDPNSRLSAHSMLRKLAAILAADVVGYSKLVGDDEESTLALFHQYGEIVAALVSSHGGRVFNIAGDALMAEFSSPVEAVRTSLAIQHELKQQNENLAKHRQMHFRIGVHLGDVVFNDENLEGDGVNIAARLQGLADAGGILISEDVYRQVRGKVDADFNSMGERRLKNISEPVLIYRVLPKSRSWFRRLRRRAASHRSLTLATSAAIVIVAAGAALSFVISPNTIQNTIDSITNMVGGLPEEPSIAVLPLKTLSSNPQEDYFGDGLTIDITGELSRFKNLFVIASNSAFAYKNKPTNVQAIGRELGVRYLLHGTVQRNDRRVRISAQLVDATNGRQIWSDRYDRQGGDLFAIQDDIIETVVARLAIQVDAAEKVRIMDNPTQNPEAYDHYLKGRQLFGAYSREGNASAIKEFSSAIDLDKEFARAYSWLGYAHLENYKGGWTSGSDNSADLAVRFATQGIEKAPLDYYTHWTLASVYMELKDMEGARKEYNLAYDLNANDPDLLAEMADMLSFQGDSDRAKAQIERAKRLNPDSPEWYQWSLAFAHFQAREYDETVKLLTAMSDLPNEAYLTLAISRANLGKPIPPDEIMKNLRAKDPEWTPEHLDRMPFEKAEDQEHWMTGLTTIGIQGQAK